MEQVWPCKHWADVNVIKIFTIQFHGRKNMNVWIKHVHFGAFREHSKVLLIPGWCCLLSVHWNTATQVQQSLVFVITQVHYILAKLSVQEWRSRRRSKNRHEREMKECPTISGLCKLPNWPLLIFSSNHVMDRYTHSNTQTRKHTDSQGSHQYSLLRNLSGSLHLVLITHRGWRLDQSE